MAVLLGFFTVCSLPARLRLTVRGHCLYSETSLNSIQYAQLTI
jgi:hypothetical protein